MPDNILQVQITADVSRLTAGMSEAGNAAEVAAQKIKVAFGSVANAPAGLQNSLLVLQTASRQSAEAVQEASAAIASIGASAKTASTAVNEFGDVADVATNRATVGANNARIAWNGLTREMGLGGNRALGTFIAQSQTLGPILNAAFSGIAIAGFIQLAVLAAEKISILISDTWIFTAAEKALNAQLLADNASIDASYKQHTKNLRDLAVVGKSVAEAERMRAQWAKEDANGLKQTIDLKQQELDLANKLHQVEIDKGKQRTLQPVGRGVQSIPVDNSAAIKDADIKVKSLSSELDKLRAEYMLAGDAATEFGAKANLDTSKEAEKEAEKLEKIARHNEQLIAEVGRKRVEQFEFDQRLAQEEAAFFANAQEKETAAATKGANERFQADAQFEQDRIRDKEKASVDAIAIKELQVKSEFALGKISAQQEAQQLTDLEAEKLATEKAYIQQRIDEILARKESDDAKSYAEDMKEWSKLLTEKQKLEDQYLKNRAQIIDTSAKDEEKRWDAVTKKINSTFDQSIQGLIHGTETFGKAFATLFDSLLADFTSFLANQALKWGEHQLVLLAEHIATQSGMTAATAAGTAARGAIDKVHSLAGILRAAGHAAAKAMAEVPFPLNLIEAPLIFGATLAFGAGLPSAAGGMDVPSDMLAMVHKNEMVLPSSLADRVRSVTEPSGGSFGGNAVAGGGGPQISISFGNISAVDARGIKDVLTQQRAHIADIVRQELRRTNQF